VASTSRTRIERDLDAEAVRRMKTESTRDLTVGGPCLAAHALAAGLVDECQLFVAPITVGGGYGFFPCRPGAETEAGGLTPLRERRCLPSLPSHRVRRSLSRG